MLSLPEVDLRRSIHADNLPEIDSNYLPENVTLHVHLAPHENNDDFAGAGALLDSADIYIPEAPAHTPQIRQTFKDISRGDQKRFKRFIEYNSRSTYVVAEASALYGKYIPVVFTDVEDNGYQIDESTNYLRKGFTGELISSLSGFADLIAGSLSKQREREYIILGNLGSKVTSLVLEHPKLSKKDDVNALAVFGDMHSHIYDVLAISPVADRLVGSHRYEAPSETPLMYRIMRKYIEGAKPTTQEMLALMAETAITAAIIDAPLTDAQRQAIESGSVSLNRINNELSDLLMEDTDAAAEIAMGLTANPLDKSLRVQVQVLITESAQNLVTH